MTPLLLWTRPEPPDAGSLRREGVEYYWLPLLAIEPLTSAPGLNEELHRAQKADAMVFVSPASVRAAVGLCPALRASTAPLFAVGAATGAAINDEFGRGARWPPEQADSEHLLPMIIEAAPGSVALFCAPNGRELLMQGLRQAGIEVVLVHAYQRIVRIPSVVEHAALIHERDRVVLMATSVTLLQGLRAVLAALPEEHEQELLARPLVCASQRIGEQAELLGFTSIRIASGADQDAMLAAMPMRCGELRSPR